MKVRAKIGTWSVEVVHVFKLPQVGMRVRFRRPGQRRWENGVCDRINDDGLLFIYLL